MKYIVIYSGRFQPFGKHHCQSYKHLCEKFGTDNVFIATTNKTDELSPLNFNEKTKIINKYGIRNVYCVKDTYKCREITQLFDPKNTAVIFALGKKDINRLNTQKYFKYFTNTNDLVSMLQHGFLYILPHVSIHHDNIEYSGTNLRKILSTSDPVETKKVMGWYDPYIDSLFKTHFKVERLEENIINVLYESDRITKTQLQRIEQYVDKFFSQFGIDVDFGSKHFYDRLNDPRNSIPITSDDLRKLFKKVSIKHGLHLSKMNTGAEAVIKDMETDINIPFVMKWDKDNQEIDLIPKTIMRKKDFSTPSQQLTVENFKPLAYSKHIMHPYEDPNMDSNELYEFIGEIFSQPCEHRCTVKMDGYNYKITVQNGIVKAARNKSTIINPMSVQDVENKYGDKPLNKEIFTSAHKAMVGLLSTFSPKYLDSIFNNGRTFLNIEILHPKSINIFQYKNVPLIYMHSLITYDESGNEINNSTIIPTEFSSDNRYNNFLIKPTPTIQLNLDQSMKSYFINKIKKNVEPVKDIILELGNYIMSTLPRDKENEQNIYDILKKVKQLMTTDEALFKFNEIMSKVKEIHGMEGIVIERKGQLYKFTGSFGHLIPLLTIYNKHRYNK